MSEEKNLPKPVINPDSKIPKEVPNLQIEKSHQEGRLDESRIPTFENPPPPPAPIKDKGEK